MNIFEGICVMSEKSLLTIYPPPNYSRIKFARSAASLIWTQNMKMRKGWKPSFRFYFVTSKLTNVLFRWTENANRYKSKGNASDKLPYPSVLKHLHFSELCICYKDTTAQLCTSTVYFMHKSNSFLPESVYTVLASLQLQTMCMHKCCRPGCLQLNA